MKIKNIKAFTLIETLVAVFISAIILSGLYSALIVGNRTWAYYKESISHKNEVRKAMVLMTNELREAKNIIIAKQLNGIRINFYRSKSGFISYIWNLDGNEAGKIIRVSGSDTKMMADKIGSLDFVNFGDAVLIDIISEQIVKKNTMTEIHLRKKVTLRNKNKLFL